MHCEEFWVDGGLENPRRKIIANFCSLLIQPISYVPTLVDQLLNLYQTEWADYALSIIILPQKFSDLPTSQSYYMDRSTYIQKSHIRRGHDVYTSYLPVSSAAADILNVVGYENINNFKITFLFSCKVHSFLRQRCGQSSVDSI